MGSNHFCKRLIFLNVGHTQPLLVLFLVFSNKRFNYIQQSHVKTINLGSFRCWDSNSQPFDCVSPTLIARPGFIYSHNVISLNNTLGVGSRLLFMRYDNVTAYASPQPRAILVEGSLTTHPLSCTVREGKYFLF